jgi:radical SAM protein with 4Fe4S-binding SPASM domain
MSFDLFTKVIDEGEQYLMEVAFAGYGEPFLNKQTVDMIEYAKQKNIFVEVYTTLAVDTPRLNEEDMERLVKCGMDRVIVSVDSSKEETFQAYKRAGSLSETLNKLETMSELKRESQSIKPQMIFQYVVFDFNESEIPEAKVQAKRLGMEFQPKSGNVILGGGNLEEEMKHVSKNYNRYNYEIKEPVCPWIYDNCVVFANGDVTVCCYEAHGEFIMGNVLNEPLGEIFNGEKYREFRRSFKEDSDKISICSECTAKYR